VVTICKEISENSALLQETATASLNRDDVLEIVEALGTSADKPQSVPCVVLCLPADIHEVIYTTNTIGALNTVLRQTPSKSPVCF